MHSFTQWKYKKCNNSIKFKIKDLFYARNGELFSLQMNTKNKFLMSKSRIQRTLIKRALEICKKCWTAQIPLRHSLTLSVCLNIKRIGEIICLIAVWQTPIKIDNLLLTWLMTINYDWYTTNYRHTAACATLIVKATVYNKPFRFNWS